MIHPFAGRFRRDQTGGPLARRRDGEARAVPGFSRPPTFTRFSISSIPFLFLPLTLPLLLVFYQGESHSLHHHKLFEILTRDVHLAQESIECRVLSLIASPPSTARPTPLSITTFFGQGVDSSARNSNGNEPVPDLSHDNPPVGPSLSLSPNCSQLRLPIRPDLINSDDLGTICAETLAAARPRYCDLGLWSPPGGVGP